MGLDTYLLQQISERIVMNETEKELYDKIGMNLSLLAKIVKVQIIIDDNFLCLLPKHLRLRYSEANIHKVFTKILSKLKIDLSPETLHYVFDKVQREILSQR
jgi:hypothetical protein